MKSSSLKKRKKKSAYYNFLWLNYYKSTSNGSDTVLLKCFTLPTRRKLHQGEGGLPHLCSGIRRKDGAITAERQRQLEQASQGGWQQQSQASLPEVRGVTGLALKKSLKENSYQWARDINHGNFSYHFFIGLISKITMKIHLLFRFLLSHTLIHTFPV